MLKQGNCVKNMAAAASDTLQADTGESFLIKGILAYPAATDEFLTLKVDRKTVGFYRIFGRAGNQLNSPYEYGIHANVIEFLKAGGIDLSIPVAEGQALTFSRTATTGYVSILYDRYDAGDIRADMPNGTDSKVYSYLQYITHDGVVDADEDVLMNTSLTPAEFPDFPCAAVVPAKSVIEILALVGTPHRDKSASSTEWTYTTYIKLIKERETLFDEDGHGLPFRARYDGGDGRHYTAQHSIIGSPGKIGAADVYGRMGKPFIFEPALRFLSGEELLFYVSVVSNHDHEFQTYLDLAAVLRVTKE